MFSRRPFHWVSSSSGCRHLKYVSSAGFFSPLFEEMPKVKRSRKPPPDGWELIEPTLDELDQKMREGVYVRVCVWGSWLSLYALQKKLKICENEKSNVWSVPFLSQLRPNHMKEKEKWNPFGPSSEFIIRKRAIFLISSTKGKPLAEVRQVGSFISSWKER